MCVCVCVCVCVYVSVYIGFPGSSDGKKSACNARNLGLTAGSADPLEKGMAAHSSVLAWRIPWTEQPGGLQSMGSQRVRHIPLLLYLFICSQRLRSLSYLGNGDVQMILIRILTPGRNLLVSSSQPPITGLLPSSSSFPFPPPPFLLTFFPLLHTSSSSLSPPPSSPSSLSSSPVTFILTGSQHSTCINLLNPHNHSRRQMLFLSPFCQQGN